MSRRSSARRAHYYGGPGSRVWRALHEVGLTPRLYEPHEFAKLTELGIGFADMSKAGAGADKDIKAHQYDVPRVERSMRDYRPLAIAFTSKRAAAVWQGSRSTAGIAYGRQRRRRANSPQVFVLPSPSGAAGRYGDLKPWRALGDWLLTRSEL